MRSFIVFTSVLFLASCSNNQTAVPPKEPVSVEATKNEIKNKTDSVDEVGFIHVFMEKEEPISWSKNENDTSKHFSDFVTQRKNFTLHFINDTSVQVSDEKKNVTAIYSLEKDTSKAILLKVKYADSEFSFPGSSEPMMVTYTYKIRGIDAGEMLLETPRTYNERKIVLWMKGK